MFKKILVANRGEIAVRVIRTCREMGIATVALYEPDDVASLHVRLADERVLLEHPDGFFARDALVRLALKTGADAIHPGYGFLAERPDFICACEQAGLAFIGAPVETVALIRDRVNALEIARRAGFPTVAFAEIDLRGLDLGCPAHSEAVQARADELGYPLMVKLDIDGYSQDEHLISGPEQLFPAMRQAISASQDAFSTRCIYFEKVVFPVCKVTVLLLGDSYGTRFQLGECQAYPYPGNGTLIEEIPAPCLDPAQRRALHCTALDLACLFHLTGITALDFVIDRQGQPCFTEIRAHLPVEHPLFEMVHRLDLVRQQIRLAADLPLKIEPGRLETRGAGMLCCIKNTDPDDDFLPGPGYLLRAGFPGGPDVRIDSGCAVPGIYDPLVAKLVVWDDDRPGCLQRMHRALKDLRLSGIRANLGLLQEMLSAPDFVDGSYTFIPSLPLASARLDVLPHARQRELPVLAGLLDPQSL